MARRLRVTVLSFVAGLLAAAGAAAAAPATEGPQAPGAGLAAAVQTVQLHDDALLAFSEGVVGVGAGIGEDGAPVIRVYVESLPAVGVPSALDGLPVELVVTGRVVARFHPPHFG